VLLLALSGTGLGVVVGSIVGLLSGYLGGWVDNIVQRLLESIISIPFLVLALLAIAAAGPELAGSPFLVILGGGIGLCPARCAHGALGGDRDRHPRFRDSSAAPRRERVVGDAA
jgi:peptide/nickel transport system permease protein